MKEFIVCTVVWTLALYGLFEILKEIIYMYTYTKFKSEGTYLLILTKNQEDYIENFLRTKEIVKKMAEDNENLKCLNWKECKEIIDNIDGK